MTKKSIVKVVIIAALLVILFVSGYTFSKYYQAIPGTVTGSIAKWSFVARGNGAVDINNIRLIDTANEVSLVNDKIAPGTEGSFAIEVDATGSEVGVKYSVEVTPSAQNAANPENLKFYLDGDVDGSGNQVKYDSLEELAENSLSGNILPTDSSKVKVLNIKWEWPFAAESTDEDEIVAYDNDDMEVAAGGNYTFNLRVIGEQLKNS